MKANDSLILAPDAAQLVATDAPLPPERNPYLVYIGGLDQSSRATMAASGLLIVRTLTGTRNVNPVAFPWHRLTYPVVRRLRAMLTDGGYAPRTVNKALAVARNVAKEAWLLEHMTPDEHGRICQVANVDIGGQLPAGRFVEPDEIARVLRVCADAGDIHGTRDAAIVAILVGAGLRESEAVKLKRGDYEPATGGVTVLHGKGKKQRESTVDPTHDGPLRRLVEAIDGGPGDALLPRLAPRGNVMRPLRHISTGVVQSVLERRCEQARIAQPFTPHDLRRTFITTQLERGVDPLRLARIVGHSSPKTTMIYDRRTAASDRAAIRGGAPSQQR